MERDGFARWSKLCGQLSNRGGWLDRNNVLFSLNYLCCEDDQKQKQKFTEKFPIGIQQSIVSVLCLRNRICLHSSYQAAEFHRVVSAEKGKFTRALLSNISQNIGFKLSFRVRFELPPGGKMPNNFQYWNI